MDVQATLKIPCAFADMPDCRAKNARHKLMDILTIAMFAVICGADGWVDVVEYADANYSRLCRIALNLLKAEKTQKVGIDCKRKKCGWDNQYMLKVIAG